VSPRQFAELAAIVARHAEDLSAGRGPDAAALHQVLTRASRCFRQWKQELSVAASPQLYARIIAAELPLRVWCTAVSAKSDTHAAGPAIADKIFGELLELRCLMLQALAADHGLTAAEAALLDRYRRRCERWTDALLAPLVVRTKLTDFAICPERTLDFATPAATDPQGMASWPLAVVGLRLAFTPADRFRRTESSAEDGVADTLAAAILASFPASAFGTEGRLRCPSLARIGRIVAETAPPSIRPRAARRPPLPPAASPPANASSSEPLKPVEAPRPATGLDFAALRRGPRRSM
jgi:hypothetical protein